MSVYYFMNSSINIYVWFVVTFAVNILHYLPGHENKVSVYNIKLFCISFSHWGSFNSISSPQKLNTK